MLDVCTVTYNNINYTRLFLHSLYKNTSVPLKLYVYDNGSDDGTVEFLKDLENSDPNVHVYYSDCNEGWAKGLIWGIGQGNNPYVLFANNDILLPENWFQIMSNHFTEDVGAVGPISDYVMGRQGKEYSFGQMEEDEEILIHFCTLYRRDVIKKIGIPDINFPHSSDDIDYSIRARDAGYRLVIARDCFVKHFGFITYRSNPDYEKILKEDREKLEIKHGKERTDYVFIAKPTVIMCIPFMGDVDPDWISYILNLVKPAGRGAFRFAKITRTPIVIARNLLTKVAVDCYAQYCLFVDSDILMGANSLMKLLKIAYDNKEIAIIGGLAYKRNPPFDTCAFVKDKDMWHNFDNVDSKEICEVDEIGMGFTLIRTDVIEAVAKAYSKKGTFTPFASDNNGTRDDLTFCRRARKLGYRIFIDPQMKLGHFGDRCVIDIGTQKEYREKHLKETDGKSIN